MTADDSGTLPPPGPAANENPRISVYLTPGEFADARAAYLSDWQHGGTASTFTAWIADAITAHAVRTARQRAARARPASGERGTARTGITRSFAVPADTLRRLRSAITADNAAGRWPSDSAWIADAIASATALARERAGGDLPDPPPRLPSRLTR